MPEIQATDSTHIVTAVMMVTRNVPAVDHPEGQPIEKEAKVELNAVFTVDGERRYGPPFFTCEYNLTEGEKRALLEKAGLTAPVVIDTPHLSQEGDVLTCTKGNWKEDPEPNYFTYQWQRDAENIEHTSPQYTVTEEDAGHTFTCIVTAVNLIGSTPATSNEVDIPGGASYERETSRKRDASDRIVSSSKIHRR